MQQPSPQKLLHQHSRRFLSGNGILAESQSTLYDGYQQAWRMLGFYVDCRDTSNQNADGNENEGSSSNTCQRYLLWAAYVDHDYQGGGLGEYQFYDIESNSWDDSACELSGGERCAKMDCHEANTNWQLLGFFKQPYYASEWFEQLFKHQGYCLWNSDTYSFMQTNYAAWPEYCTDTGLTVDNGEGEQVQLYVDLMPGINMQLGLYTDSICKTEFTGAASLSDTDAYDSALKNAGYLTRDTDLTKWNNALNVYKYCQPCRTFDLKNTGYSKNNNDRRRVQDENNYYDPNNGLFACTDDAGYTNVNQCMKFRSQTTMQPAVWKDIEMAVQQGVEVSIAGKTYSSPMVSISNSSADATSSGLLMLTCSVAFLVASMASVIVAVRWKRKRRNDRKAAKQMAAPLVYSETQASF